MTVPKRFTGAMFLHKGVDLKVGDTCKIVDEFTTPPHPKYPSLKQGFLIGTVEFNGVEYILSLNKTSYDKIANKYGVDTVSWVGAMIKYSGEVKMGAMMGRLFEPI